MPELPEVETICRAIAPHLTGTRLLGATVRQPKLRWPVAEQLYRLQPELILSVQRRAKYLLIQLNSGWIIVHLGMTGTLRLLSADTPPNKHDHIDLHLADHRLLRFTDPRRFGAWLWSDDAYRHRLLVDLGREPLQAACNGAYLYHAAQGRRTVTKVWLMDHHVVVGIGNIYASEALHRAKISPFCPANQLTQQQSERLAAVIKQVLLEAIEHGGSSIRDFMGADGKPGYFSQQLQVYGRVGLPCYHCATPIVKCKQGQRSTFYCSCCQAAENPS